MLNGKTILGVGFDKIEGAWILDFGPHVELWFTFDNSTPLLPTVEFKHASHQEDLDIRWMGIWLGFSRRY
jgi:hypothetical protein